MVNNRRLFIGFWGTAFLLVSRTHHILNRRYGGAFCLPDGTKRAGFVTVLRAVYLNKNDVVRTDGAIG